MKKTLSAQPRYRFSDWNELRREIPTEAGIYTVWRGEKLLYVGVAGTGKKHRGLRERLAQHRRGKRGGDQFSVLVFDRFVLPELTRKHISDVVAGRLSLDEKTSDFVQKHLRFAFLVIDIQTALQLEAAIRKGGWKHGTPLLNPADQNE